MPFNGSGTYAAPSSPGAFNPAITGQNATPAAWNTLLADISTALSTTITKDGQTTITQDIPFAAHKITDLGDATAQTDALNQRGALYIIDQQDITAQTVIDFTGIPATVNNIEIRGNLDPGTDGQNLLLRTYGADGVLDTGGSDYAYWHWAWSSAPSSSVVTAGSSAILLAQAIDNASHGCNFVLAANNIQALTYTMFNGSSSFLDSGGSNAVGYALRGARVEADRITGVRLLMSSGDFTGRVTLYGSV